MARARDRPRRRCPEQTEPLGPLRLPADIANSRIRLRRGGLAAEIDPAGIGGQSFLRCEIGYSITWSAMANSVSGR
jgi:hypothetical protein